MDSLHQLTGFAVFRVKLAPFAEPDLEGFVFPLSEDVQVADGRLLDLAVGEDSPAHSYGVLFGEVGDRVTLLVNRCEG